MSAFQLPAFYPVLDTGILFQRGMDAIQAAETILEGGACILQLRHKGFFSREMFETATRLAALCNQANAIFVMNDRADIARLLGSALHLGQEDLTPADARTVTLPGTILGLSTHNERQLRAGDREAVDYLAIGPIFATGSKQNPDPVVGPETLRSLRAITQKPLVAIGGITKEKAPVLFKAGANSVAILGDLYPAPLTKPALRSRVEEWLAVCQSTASRRPQRI